MSSLTCPYYIANDCRSCTMLRFDSVQKYKKSKEALFRSIQSELPADVDFKPFIFPDNLFASRVKAKLSVSGSIESPCIGLLHYDGQNEPLGTALLDCPLHIPPINKILHSAKEFISRIQLMPYHAHQRTGELKGIIIKSNEDASEILLRFILRSADAIDRILPSVAELQSLHPHLKVISANIQPIPHAILEGPEEILLTADQHIKENFNGTALFFGPQSFSQVTHETASILYESVAEHIQAVSGRRLLDLFCGVGGFSLLSSRKLESSLGIEISPDAIRCATAAAKYNGITNSQFISADVLSFLNSNQLQVDTILCNPPRRGLGPELIATLPKVGATHFIYSSCNPKSFLADYKELQSYFKLTSIQPFDMFPLTEHMEILACFQRIAV